MITYSISLQNCQYWYFLALVLITVYMLLILFGIGFDYCLHARLASYRICLPLQIFNLGLYDISFCFVSNIIIVWLQPSYRKYRDYTNDFNWRCELKTGAYKCYVQSRNNKSIGYMKWIKNLWDKINLEYNFLSDKNLDIKHLEFIKALSQWTPNIVTYQQKWYDSRCIVTGNRNNYGP